MSRSRIAHTLLTRNVPLSLSRSRSRSLSRRSIQDQVDNLTVGAPLLALDRTAR